MSYDEQHVFIIGSKGIPAAYGGFESFVDRLTFYRKSSVIKYHVACAVPKNEYDKETRVFEYNYARCFKIPWKNVGSAKAIFYDIDALKESINYAKEHKIKHPIFYILACRIGPFISKYKKQITKMGGILLVNPDGHEWKRAKWSAPVRRYWKESEKLMVKYADLLICDSKSIEKYIKEDYKKYNPKTTFIAYGANVKKSNTIDDSKFNDWCNKFKVSPKEYYLVVGRFVPENNFETMVREFMKSKTKKDFVLVTGIRGEAFYQKLMQSTHFDKDSRIKFVGTVYDKTLLQEIRENAYGYFHGHEVGGTNPSLLEALGSTDLNLLLNVNFNSEVAEDSALYWSKEDGNLASLIEKADKLTKQEIDNYGKKAKQRILDAYSWDYIVSTYESVFLNCFSK